MLRAFRRVPRSFVLSGALATGVLAFAGAGGLSDGHSLGSGRRTAPSGPAIKTQVLGENLTASTTCPPSGFWFCIAGSTTGVGPNSPQLVTLTLSNPNSFPIYVTSLSVSAQDTNTVKGLCPGSITITSPGWAAVDTSPVPTDAIAVGPASSSGPGTTTKTITVKWLDSTSKDQTQCEGTSIPLSYGGHAVWFGNCISGPHNGGVTVPPNQVDCVSSTGRVTGGITVPSGSGLVLMNGASVTGGIKANSGASEFLLCGASVTGGITVSGATGPVVVGTGNYCPPTSITGGLFLTNNTGGIEVVGNRVTGGLTVTGNSGSVPSSQSGGEPASVGSNQYVGGNNISGGITCSPNNSPGLSHGGSPNSVSGPRTGSQCQGGF